jgi:NAD(P)-dependent dehydrogenase (short-subunit alcohol dehydrogenase family)
MVTGGARGIGAATARLAAERGYAVGVNYLRNAAAADTVSAKFRRRAGGRLLSKLTSEWNPM